MRRYDIQFSFVIDIWITFSPLRIIENGQFLLNHKKEQDKAKGEEAKAASEAVKKAAQTNGVKDSAAPSAPSKNGGGDGVESEPKVVVEQTRANVSTETFDWRLWLIPFGCGICLYESVKVVLLC